MLSIEKVRQNHHSLAISERQNQLESIKSLFRANPTFQVEKITEIRMPKPAFLNIIKTSEGYDLYVSSFKFGMLNLTVGLYEKVHKDNSIKVIKNIEAKLSTSKKMLKVDNDVLDRKSIWPNGVVEVNKNFLNREGVIVCSGFLMPGATNGQIVFIDKNTKERIPIKTERNGKYYHNAIPFRFEGQDGLLTARTNVTLFNKASQYISELIWLKKPHKLGTDWEEKVLFNGPDINFRTADLEANGSHQIISAEYFNDKLTMAFDENGRFSKKIIDSNLGNPFDAEVVDYLDKKALLVTNHQKSGKVLLYEIPSDFKNDVWKKHIIASSIKVVANAIGDMAPGKAFPIYIGERKKSKPYFIVSGDASREVYLLSPKKQDDPNNFEYNKNTIFKCNSTIGQIAHIKQSSSNIYKLFIPLYEENKIVALELKIT